MAVRKCRQSSSISWTWPEFPNSSNRSSPLHHPQQPTNILKRVAKEHTTLDSVFLNSGIQRGLDFTKPDSTDLDAILPRIQHKLHLLHPPPKTLPAPSPIQSHPHIPNLHHQRPRAPSPAPRTQLLRFKSRPAPPNPRPTPTAQRHKCKSYRDTAASGADGTS
jgi:hypothetical protein